MALRSLSIGIVLVAAALVAQPDPADAGRTECVDRGTDFPLVKVGMSEDEARVTWRNKLGTMPYSTRIAPASNLHRYQGCDTGTVAEYITHHTTGTPGFYVTSTTWRRESDTCVTGWELRIANTGAVHDPPETLALFGPDWSPSPPTTCHPSTSKPGTRHARPVDMQLSPGTSRRAPDTTGCSSPPRGRQGPSRPSNRPLDAGAGSYAQSSCS